jgi:serine/threonine protein phosphatase PrpC
LAARLQLKLGAITDQDRLADSPDTSVVVEPSVGSVARTKGSLYLLVTSRQAGSRAREATRVVAETIRNEYYYDESAGIRQCLTKVLSVANKRLAHQRDRYGLGHQSDGAGPIGVAVAVVRGRELYVATVGPAEAYLIRQARLSTLPDPNGERGMPVVDLEPEVWRGELNVGDSLCLVSANVVARVGTDVLKDALVTLHPQSAVEHLHAAFVAADGMGSDGAVAIEATEVGATQKARTLVPVRPAEPLAGAPDRSPIPLADSVSAGAAALGASAGRARNAAGNGLERLIWRIQDRLPRRGPASRTVGNASGRMETQRRAAVGLLAFVVVAGALVLGVYAAGGQRAPVEAIKSLTAAEQAFEAATEALAKVSGPGIDLITDAPARALELLNTAYEELARAEAAGYPAARIAPLRKIALAGLDRLYGMVNVTPTDLFTFPTDTKPVTLAGLVIGSDGAPYVLDTANKTVWRIDLAAKTAKPVAKSGQKASGTKLADPKFLVTGGPDVLILDAKNILWRWRPADTKGKGTLVRIKVAGASSWGDDILGIGTFVANFDAAFYKLYIIDPSEQNIMVLSPANDGSGYPVAPGRKLPADRPVDAMTDLLIDGDIFVAEGGEVARVIPASKWAAELPGDTQLRSAPNLTILSSPNLFDGSTSKRKGPLYAFDTTNHRLIAFNKLDGAYLGQYQLAGGDDAWAGLVDMVVRPPVEEDGPATMWWISATGLHSAVLEAALPGGGASPTPPAESPSAPAPVAPTKVPAKTPKP